MMIKVSVIVPAYNSPEQLAECVSALKISSVPESEIIVVDDASTDATPVVAARMGVRVVRMERNSGPGAARNYGACHARGEILFFVDADVIVWPGAIQRVVEMFDAHPGAAAVFGSYDTSPRARGIVSQYRNLLHHYVHQTGNRLASTFWAGCGAVRRAAFDTVGGFDAQRFPRPSIEDIELGYRLRRAGYQILLDKSLQGTHVKRWTLWSMFRTDVTCRAIPWTRLLLETGDAMNDLNLKPGQRLSGALVLGATVLIPFGIWRAELWIAAAVALLGVGALNWRVYAFFARTRSLRFAAACIPLHFLYYLYSVLSFAYVRICFTLRGWTAGSGTPVHGEGE